MPLNKIIMTVDQLKQEHPEIHKDVLESAFKDGKTKERKRIAAWMLQITPINTQLIKSGILSENLAPDPLQELNDFNIELEKFEKNIS
jgi:hypothetical protein